MYWFLYEIYSYLIYLHIYVNMAFRDTYLYLTVWNTSIVLIIILIYLIYLTKLWIGSTYAQNLQQIHKICTEKHLLYNILFWQFVTIMDNKLHMQSVLKANGLNSQMNFYTTHYYMINFLKIL